MADPNPYVKGYSFVDWQASNPTRPLPATNVDNELAGIATATVDIIDALKDIRRSDGKLVNGIVTSDALDADLTASFSGGAVSAWGEVVPFAAGIAAQIVAPKTVVTYNGSTYVCAVAHTTTSTFQSANWTKIAAKGDNGTGSGDMLAANNLSDLTNATQARTNLGLGGLATKSAVGAAEITDGSVGTAELGSNVVTPAKIAMGSWTSVASAATVDLGALATRNVIISGTTTITSFGTTDTADRLPFFVRFAGILTLTHNASTLILPRSTDIITAVGDCIIAAQETGGVWRVLAYTSATGVAADTLGGKIVGTSANNIVALDASAKLPAVDGSQLTSVQTIVQSAVVNTTSGTAISFTGIPSTAKRVTVYFDGVSTSGTSAVIVQLGSTTFTTSGYVGAAGLTLATTTLTSLVPSNGFGSADQTGAAMTRAGVIVLEKQPGTNVWVASGGLVAETSTSVYNLKGKVTVGGVLDRVRITAANGTDTFDAGKAWISWE